MQTPEALKQFWIPELDDIHHYLAGISANTLVGMGALVAITTYWLASRQRTLKLGFDPNKQSVELPVGGLFYFAALPDRTDSCTPECSMCNWRSKGVWSEMNVQDTHFSGHFNKHA